ncbi:unnamed protein product [Ixodes pacificus]
MFSFFFLFFLLCVYPVLNHFLCSNWMASLDAFCAQQSTRTLAFNNSCRLHSSICMHQEVKWRHMWPICFGPSGNVLFDVGILLHHCILVAIGVFHWQVISPTLRRFIGNFFHRRCLHLFHQKPLFMHVVLAVGILFLCSRVAS